MTLQEIKNTLLNKNPKYNQETKYIKWYFNIIEARLIRDDNNSYQKHHILPRALFPKYVDFNNEYKWNKVLLTKKEHILIHILIWKHYNKIRYTYGEIKTSKAMKMMFNVNGNLSNKYIANYKHTDETKKLMSQSRLGKKHSKETKIKIGIAHKNKKIKKEAIYKAQETRRKNNNLKPTEESNKKRSISLKKYYKENIEAIEIKRQKYKGENNPNYNKKRSDEWKKLHSELLLSKNHSKGIKNPKAKIIDFLMIKMR